MIVSPYAPFLHSVEKPGRYVGGEFGSVPPKENAAVRIALAFPDAYEIGMSHIGLSILYEVINADARFSAERSYMPWPDMAAVIRENELPLVALESSRPLCEFDVVGFSLQYELTFTNVLAMLDMGRIPRRAAKRSEGDPLVIVGGPVAVQAEPMGPFVDLVVPGDGEAAVPELLGRLAELKEAGASRAETVEALAALPFAYAPALLERAQSGHRMVRIGEPVARMAYVPSLQEYPSGAGPVPMVQAVFDRYSVEIARGCVEGCRFCQAGYLYRPVRERDTSAVRDALEKATCALGFDEVSLSALSSADHSQIDGIVTGLGTEYMNQRVSFSVPSLRAYGLSDEVVDVLGKLRASGVTLAPEAGSQRLRDVVNKNISEDDLFGAAGRFFDRGFTRIKLYFMLGLPTETDADLAQIVDLAVRMRRLGRSKVGKRTQVTISVSTFVPKPFTPFEREPMIGEEEILRRQGLLRELARAEQIRLKTHDVRMSVLEGVFARGDWSLADVLDRAVDGGACFDGWDELYKHDVWTEALEGVDVDGYLEGIPDDGALPWSLLESGVTPGFRRKERDRAYQVATTRPCGVFAGEENEFVCHACGLKCDAATLPVRPERLPATTESTPVERPKGRPRPGKVVQAGEEAVRYRFEVASFGRQVFIGHLDTMRHLMRSFRRAGIDVWYTEGFHPKPKVEAPSPVPLGTAVMADPYEFWLAKPMAEEEVMAALRESLPPDLEVRSVQRLEPGTPRLSRAYNACRYVALVRAPEKEVKAALAKLAEADVLEVTRERKGRQKVVELKQYVVETEIVDAATMELPLAAASVEGRCAVAMTLRVPGSGGTRPSELLGQYLDVSGDNLWVVRTGWLLLEEEAPAEEVVEEKEALDA